MAVPTRITDLSATAASNSPAGSDSVGPSLDDYLRGIQAVLRGDLASKGADIASASTTDLGAIQGLFHDITGTVTITSFGTVAAGVWKVIKFEGALTLTHNASSLILLSGTNRTTVNGDIGMYASEGSGNWREVFFSQANQPSTWTPTMNANLTLLAANAVQQYQKIGRMVTLFVSLVVDTVSGTDNVTMSLPFPAAAAPSNGLGIAYEVCSTSGVDTGGTGLVAVIAAGASVVTFYQNNDNAGQAQLTNAHLANADIIGATISYLAAT